MFILNKMYYHTEADLVTFFIKSDNHPLSNIVGLCTLFTSGASLWHLAVLSFERFYRVQNENLKIKRMVNMMFETVDGLRSVRYRHQPVLLSVHNERTHQTLGHVLVLHFTCHSGTNAHHARCEDYATSIFICIQRVRMFRFHDCRKIMFEHFF